MSIKGLVKVKGSWGMGGGLLGVASFSLSWLSVSMPVAIFLAARGFLRAAVRLYYGCLTALHGCGLPCPVLTYLVFAVGMRGQGVCESLLRAGLQAQALDAGLQLRA